MNINQLFNMQAIISASTNSIEAVKITISLEKDDAEIECEKYFLL